MNDDLAGKQGKVCPALWLPFALALLLVAALLALVKVEAQPWLVTAHRPEEPVLSRVEGPVLGRFNPAPPGFDVAQPEVYGDAFTTHLPLVTLNFPPHLAHLPLTLRNCCSHTPAPTPTPTPTPTPPPDEVIPDDPYFPLQWGLTRTLAPRAWAISQGRPDIVIAVIDTGADLDHEDLAAKLITVYDWDWVDDDDSADDEHTSNGWGHGTHVAGIAAGATDNSVGIAGMGWKSTILPLRILDAAGDGSDADLVAAIVYAADHGAHVINMSLGGTGPCEAVVQAGVDYAYEQGLVLVAAAGNTEGQTENFPANCQHVLGVSATDPDDGFASFSNYGNHVLISAPGSGIFSTRMGGGYEYKSGTSMATPFVAGLAALVFAHYPDYTPDQVASAILDNGVDLGTAGWDMYFGCGRIDAHQTLLKGARAASPLCAPPAIVLQGGQPAPVDHVPGELLVILQPAFPVAAAVERLHACGALSVDSLAPPLRLWRVGVPPGREEEAIARLRADPAVEAVSRTRRVTALQP